MATSEIILVVFAIILFIAMIAVIVFFVIMIKKLGSKNEDIQEDSSVEIQDMEEIPEEDRKKHESMMTTMINEDDTPFNEDANLDEFHFSKNEPTE